MKLKILLTLFSIFSTEATKKSCVILLLDKIDSDNISKIQNILTDANTESQILHLYDKIALQSEKNVIQELELQTFSKRFFENNKIPNNVKLLLELFQKSDFQIFITNSRSYLINSTLIQIFEWFEGAYDKNVLANKNNIIITFSQSHKLTDANSFKAITLNLILNKMQSTNIKGYLPIQNANNLPNEKFKILPQDENKIKEYIKYVIALS